ncbi:MAG TPA: hypothetical protein VF507_04330 [Pyrinomonadaceae bacterium]
MWLERMAISAGQLFELLRPAAWAVSVLLSAWVLANARRRNLAAHRVAALTLGTLLLPLVVFPLYLAWHIITRARGEDSTERDSGPTDEKAEDEEAAGGRTRKATRWNWLPFAYAALLLTLVTVYFYRDYRSVDAHLARANQARLLARREKTISEYRAALALADDAHTRALLGVELADAGRFEEALAEFRAAERGGEPDDALAFRTARALDALGRADEALPEYGKFLQSRLCNQPPPDFRCESARARLQDGGKASAR